MLHFNQACTNILYIPSHSIFSQHLSKTRTLIVTYINHPMFSKLKIPRDDQKNSPVKRYKHERSRDNIYTYEARKKAETREDVKNLHLCGLARNSTFLSPYTHLSRLPLSLSLYFFFHSRTGRSYRPLTRSLSLIKLYEIRRTDHNAVLISRRLRETESLSLSPPLFLFYTSLAISKSVVQNGARPSLDEVGKHITGNAEQKGGAASSSSSSFLPHSFQ